MEPLSQPPVDPHDVWEVVASPQTLLNLPSYCLQCIASYLDVPSLLFLSATCRTMTESVLQNKSIWLDALENVLLVRPVPLSYRVRMSRWTTAEVSLAEIRSAVLHATRLNRNWSQPIIKPTRVVKRSISEKETIQWIWNLDIDRYMMTVSASNVFNCHFNETGEDVSIQLECDGHCWDFDFDSEGITIVFNLQNGHLDAESTDVKLPVMRVYRINLKYPSYEHIKTIPTRGHTQSNVLEDDIVACITDSNDSSHCYTIYAMNWRTRKWAIINTGIQVFDRFLSASTNKKHLLLWIEGFNIAYSWCWELSHIAHLIDQAESPSFPHRVSLPPHYQHETRFLGQGVGYFSIPTTRGMWNRRKCVISRCYYHEAENLCVTFSLVLDGTEGENLYERDDNQSSTISTKSTSRKTFTYSFDESRLAVSQSDTNIFSFGKDGKHAFWVEESDSGYKLVLATFDHNDDAPEGPVNSTVSEIRWLGEGDLFDWTKVTCLDLDDNLGLITIVTDTQIWKLYFD